MIFCKFLSLLLFRVFLLYCIYSTILAAKSCSLFLNRLLLLYNWSKCLFTNFELAIYTLWIVFPRWFLHNTGRFKTRPYSILHSDSRSSKTPLLRFFVHEVRDQLSTSHPNTMITESIISKLNPAHNNPFGKYQRLTLWEGSVIWKQRKNNQKYYKLQMRKRLQIFLGF